MSNSRIFDNIPFVRVQELKHPILQENSISLGIARLDEIDLLTGGNKWFKLKYNIKACLQQRHSTVLTFGGPYSNHIAATAAICHQLGLKSIGIIRSAVAYSNATLNLAQEHGMKLHFVSKEQYALKETPAFQQELKNLFDDFYQIPEGAANELGTKGCEEIWSQLIENKQFDWKSCSHFACPIGRGSTFSGLLNSNPLAAKGLGFTGFKMGESMQEIIKTKVPNNQNWELITNYHFGGFGKSNPTLQQFQSEFKTQHHIELDRVYTAKMLFGVFDMIRHNKFAVNSKILAFHTGGIQGN